MHKIFLAFIKPAPGILILAMVMFLSTACTEKSTELLSFSISSTVEGPCTDGMTEIEIIAKGGTKPLIYYVIPEEQWISGDMMRDMLLRNDFSRLYRYTYDENKIPIRGGTMDTPRIYWVAVQDFAGSCTLSGSNMNAWWRQVKVTCSGSPGN